MIEVRVLDTAGNVFALTGAHDNDQAFDLVRMWVTEGFRVLVIPIVGLHEIKVFR
jgi:hypothetical protein